MSTVDPRLIAIYNEYLEAGKEKEFIEMLYMLLDAANQDVRMKVSHAHAAWKRKMGAPARKAMKSKIDAYFAAMTPDELIAFQNTPWEQLPEWIREAMPKIVRHPETNNFVRIYDLVNKPQRQKEITASRITRYMEKKRYVTSDERGDHLHFDNFVKVINEHAERYDLPWVPGKKAQSVRITKRDLRNYTECRVTPKGDKMAILAKATGLPLWYLAGYMKNTVPGNGTDDPLVPAPNSKFRKGRKESGDDAA